MNAPRELPADMRQAVAQSRALFEGFVQEGFSVEQALYLVAAINGGKIAPPKGDDQ